MEILLRGIGLFNAIPVILASVIGAAVAASFLGQKPAFNAEGLASWTPPELIFYAILGLVFGIISVIWVKTFYAIEDIFENLKIPSKYKPALGGLATGFLAMLYSEHGIKGVGYEGVNMALAGELSLLLLLTLGVLKMIATSCTVGSGGSGGIFAPSLYIGSMLGATMGLLFSLLFPSIVHQPFTYALAGMAALFAGTAQAPINVIIMIPEMSNDFSLIPPIIKTIASAITIGSGGSAGREGPIAQIGAGFASILSQKLKLSPKERELLVICGAGAGIGSIFKAPFGGALFGIEVLYKRDYEVEAFIPAIISSFIGYGVFALATGWQPIFIAPPYIFNPLELPFFAILGIISGIVSILYNTVFYGLRDKFFKQMRIPDHFKPAIGGFLLGLMAYFFPAVLGPGYGWLQLSMAGKLALSLMVILIFAKILATSFTISSGGSGGVFAPSAFIGAMLGGAIGLIFHMFFPTVVSKPEIFALIGMGAFFSGAAKVPIAAIIIISEMTGDYNILIPAILASSMAYLVSGDYTIYEKQVLTRADSPIHIPELLSGILSSLKVKNVMTKDVITIKPTATIDELEKLINESGHLGFPVVNEKGELVGIVTYEDVIKVKPGERPKMKVEDIETRKLIVAHPNETLDAVLRKIVLHDISRLPVVDPKNPKKLVGIITRYDVARAIHVK